MNTTQTGGPLGKGLETLEARFALRVTSRLHESARDVGPDIDERLRVARTQALERARLSRVAQEQSAAQNSVLSRSGAAVLGSGPSAWWVRLGAVLPILALVGGLVLIEQWHARAQIDAAAEVDAALLSDDLPPDAYNDDGFAEFLKTPKSPRD